jgi:tetratricopeptide (TPR) repeat protein
MKQKIFLIVTVVIFALNVYANKKNIDEYSTDSLTYEQNQLLYNVQKIIEDNNYDSAIIEINNYLKTESSKEHYLIYLSLGNAYSAINEFEHSQNAYNKGLKLKTNSIHIRNNLGRLYFENGEYYKAANQFIHIISLQSFPEKNYLFLIASSYLNSENYLAALEAFKKAVFYYPDDYDFRYGIIQTLFYLDRAVEALPVCLDTINLYPDNNELRLLLSQLYIQSNDYINALKTLEFIVYTGHSTKEIYLTLSDLYSYFGMYEETVYYYEKILNENNVGFEDYYRLANAYYMGYNNEKALEYINKSLQIDMNMESFFMKGKLLFELEKYEEALDTFKQAKKIFTNNGELFYLLGLTYLNLNNYIKAEETFRTAMMFDNFRHQSLARLGEIKYYSGNIQQALEYYYEAYKENPTNTEYQKMLEFFQTELNK